MLTLYRWMAWWAVRLRVVKPELEHWLIAGMRDMEAQRRTSWDMRYSLEGYPVPLSVVANLITETFHMTRVSLCFGWRLVGVCENLDGRTVRVVIAYRTIRLSYDLWGYDVTAWLDRCDDIKGLYTAEMTWLLKRAAEKVGA